ncbi:MAG: response regulator [Clostridia bacterium]
MRTIFVDDDMLSMEGFEIECGEIPGIEIVAKFTSPLDAIAYAQTHTVEFALLDIDMPEMSGLDLFDRLKSIYNDMIIVFITAHSGYTVEVIRKKADYVVFKPYDKDDVLDVIKRAKLLEKRQHKRISFKVFGHFDMFADGKLVTFRTAKAKEVLALCVCRAGGEVTIRDIASRLWDDEDMRALETYNYRVVLARLEETLAEVNASEIFVRKRGRCYIDKNLVECEYFDFLEGRLGNKAKLMGDFMPEYSWSEYEKGCFIG